MMPGNTPRRVALCTTASLSALMLSALPSLAYAQTQPAPQSAPPAAGAPEIVVTGFRRSAEDAVNIKRDNIAFTDSISAEGLDRFPDLNVGEALTRIPGIQLNREANNRDATVNLRGLPGSFAVVTLNGLAFGDPVLSGSTPLGAFNSDIFSRFTVIKSPTAADQAGGLSGIIDLRINSALNRKEGGSLRFTTEYNDLGSRFSPGGTISYSKKFSPDFGVFGVLTYKEENFRRDSININNYSLLTLATTPNLATVLGQFYAPPPVAPATLAAGEVSLVGGTGTTSRLGVQYPSNIRQSVKDNRGNLLTGAGGFEWRIDDRLKFATTGFYSKRELSEAGTDLYTISATNNAGASAARITPDVGSIFTTPDGRNYIERFSFVNVAAAGSRRIETSTQETWGVNPSLEWKSDDWRLSTNAIYSKAFNIFDQVAIDSTSNPIDINTAAPNGNGLTGSVFSGSGNVRALAYSITTGALGALNTVGLRPATTFGNAEQLRDRGGAGFGRLLQVTGTYAGSKNDVISFQEDVERTFHGGFLSALQAGLRYEDNKYVSTGFRLSALNVRTDGITDAFVQQSPYAFDFFGNQLPGVLTSNWQTTNLNVAIPALRPNAASLAASPLLPGQFLTPQGFVNNNLNNDYLLFNYTNANKIFSAYGLAKLDFELLGIRFRGNFGARYEKTKNQIISLDRGPQPSTANTLPVQITKTFNREYDYLLPSAILAADLTDRLTLRLGAYKTYVRPQRRELSPVTAASLTVGAGSNTYNVVIGNINLKPYTATSYDVALEWYNRKGSIVAINYFQKNIDDYITPINDTRISCPADGLFNGADYGLGTLTFNAATRECRSSVAVAGNTFPVFVNASGTINNATPVKVSGIEVNIQQNLSFLPAPWNGLGGSINYSKTSISGKTSGGANIVLNGVSKNNYNFILFYETKGFGIRAVYNYRDAYELASSGTFSGAARTARARGQLDLSSSIRLKGGFSIGIDAFNLTNSLREEYEQVDRVLRRSDYDGRTFQLTFRAPF